MFEVISLPELQKRFGDRFEDMRLDHVELLHWPVWSHQLVYETYEEVPLDPLQEGLLLLAQAGVTEPSEMAVLLGCSERYARTMASQLERAGEGQASLRFENSEKIFPTKKTTWALNHRRRLAPISKSIVMLRDAVYGNWLSHGNALFEQTDVPDPTDGRMRWLDAVVPPLYSDKDAEQRALGILPDKEVIDAHFDSAGELKWVTLRLGCYQPAMGGRGRYLLFNPAVEDTPLTSLTKGFERSLESGQLPRLYFPEAKLNTSKLFWEAMASRLSLEQAKHTIAIQKASMAEPLDQQKISKKRFTQTVPQAASEQHEQDESTQSFEIQNAKLLAEIERLEQLLRDAPRTDQLVAEEHPRILLQAIQDARLLLILISPWIKLHVLRPLMPAIDAALARGVMILIGYGMPKNNHHEDKSDVAALDMLRDRQREKKLWLVYLGTHEKVIVQDDRLFVNSSFNFFSYTGKDGRRESGTVQRGGVAKVRDTFLCAFPSHIQIEVRDRLTSSSDCDVPPETSTSLS